MAGGKSGARKVEAEAGGAARDEIDFGLGGHSVESTGRECGD